LNPIQLASFAVAQDVAKGLAAAVFQLRKSHVNGYLQLSSEGNNIVIVVVKESRLQMAQTEINPRGNLLVVVVVIAPPLPLLPQSCPSNDDLSLPAPLVGLAPKPLGASISRKTMIV